MRKNKMMRAASGLLVAVLLSTCAISGTFAKYTTSANGTDSARVAKWGFKSASVELTDLFKKSYNNADGKMTVNSGNTEDIIAPGTTNSGAFSFTYGGEDLDKNDTTVDAPEVAYEFTVSTDGSSVDSSIQANKNIQWRLDDNAWGTWDKMIADVKALSGDSSGKKEYAPNTLPDAFNSNNLNKHTVSWQWIFSTDTAADTEDTRMGNMDELDDVTLKITVTATQID